MPLTRGQLLATKPKIGTVKLLNDTLQVREVTSAEAMEYARRRTAGEGDYVAYIITAAAIDQDAKPLFTADDIPAVAALGYTIIEPIAQMIFELSGMAPAADPQTAEAEKK